MTAMTEAQKDKLEHAKSLLSRTRFGAKAVIALNTKPVHIRLGSDKEEGSWTFPENESVALLAVRVAAIGLRLQHPDLSDDDIRKKAQDIAVDLAARVEGDDRAALESAIQAGSLSLEFPTAQPKQAKKKLPVIPKAYQVGLKERGYFYLGTFEVGDALLAGDEGYVGQEGRHLRIPTRPGAWFALARRFDVTPEDPNPDQTVGALIACFHEELDGIDEMLRKATPAGEAAVDSGTFALADAAWSDRAPFEKWTQEVDHELGRVQPCRIGEKVCTSEAGWGDGTYPVQALLGRDGKARLVVVRF